MSDAPHFSFPFRLATGGGRAVVVEEDTDEEILDCVEVLLRTEVGSREDLPNYGIADPTFHMGNADLTGLLSMIEEWEPRAIVQLEETELTDQISRIRIAYTGSSPIV